MSTSYKQARGIVPPSPGGPSVETPEPLTADEWREVVTLIQIELARVSGRVGVFAVWSDEWRSRRERELTLILGKAEEQMRQAGSGVGDE